MEVSANITASVFAAYLKCPTEAYLLARGEKPTDSFFTDMRRNLSVAFKAGVRSVSSVDFTELICGRNVGMSLIFVDSGTVFYPNDQLASAQSLRRSKIVGLSSDYIPVLYSAWEWLEHSDNLLVSFGALAIAQVTGTGIPPIGRIIWGDAKHVKTITVADYLPKARDVILAIATGSNDKRPPSLVLNKHCPVCDFQSRCRNIAISQENLSLLGGMTVKEQVKCAAKGIATITQLSYGYRPRRRKRIKSTTPRGTLSLRHDHKLKALAIKKAQTHVVGSPALFIEGTPVFMDVEGVPHRDFYYLIGLRYKTQGKYVERSFWADRPEDECGIWQECLHTLKEIDSPKLVHYGAYESRFLKLMRERWKPSDDDAAFVDHVVDGSLNLLASLYGKIYFPTYSNGLKEIARGLGFKWTWPKASGGGAVLLRRCWELTSEDELRRELIAYNIEDCRAAELVADQGRLVL